ncbi:preprotein translocase subunit SecE [Metaclostridioides mangenotii]|jgi:preprotein translocase subunit SecE|uniref:Protein translocase subunit SecE n=1 Tax=Metaclostridioides mangenotii TaxID=1540 RepID=A0ABS4EDK3_9FIRM|nr:preprotein translocase subunit SecE [Clostridioides mangenotii]MBP1856019.1 preprotein translocase subunit SecE [Clostridioides mangenotii]
MTEEVKKKRFSLFRYLKETRQELKRVTWPTGKELFKNTGIVLAVVVSFTIIVWGLDTGLSWLLSLIVK